MKSSKTPDDDYEMIEDMFKSCLASFGLIFLSIVGIGLLVLFLNLSQGMPLPEIGLPATVSIPNLRLPTAFSLPGLNEVTVTGEGGAVRIEARNPLENQPSATQAPLPTPTFVPTPTPVPPLSPEVYRSEVMVQLRGFAGALDGWLKVNDRLAQDNQLINDPAWQTVVKAELTSVVGAAQAMAAVGPAPEEYSSIDHWLEETYAESQRLESNYTRGIQSQNADDFQAAGENFAQIKENLRLAVEAMLAAGWPLE